MLRLIALLLLLLVPPAFGQSVPDPDPEAELKLSLLVTTPDTSCEDMAWVENASCGDLSSVPVSGAARVWVIASRVGGFPDGIGAAQFGIRNSTSPVDVEDWTLCTGGSQIPWGEWPGTGLWLAVSWPGGCHMPAGENAVVGYLDVSDGSTGTISILPSNYPFTSMTTCSAVEASVCSENRMSLDLSTGGSPACVVASVAPVTDVAVTDNSCVPVLTWSHDGQNVGGFRIRRDGTVIANVPAESREFVDQTVVPNQIYDYDVVAFSDCDVAPPSAIVTANTTGLEAPPDCTASQDDCTGVTVAWTDTPNEDGYRLYRDTELIAVLGPDETSFFDATGSIGRAYPYSVAAFLDCGSGPLSNEAVGLRGPASATNCTASDNLCGVVEIEWVDASDDETGFDVFRAGVHIVTVGANVTFYADSTVDPGVTYEYTVEAIGACGGAVWSNADQGHTQLIEAATGTSASDHLCDVIRIQWVDNSENEAGFRVFRDGELIGDVGADVEMFDDSTGTSGSFTVQAYSDCDDAVLSNADEGVLEPALSTPSDLQATSGLCRLVKLGWNAGSGVPAGYRVYRNDALIATTTETAYEDSTSDPDVLYEYGIAAFNHCEETPKAIVSTSAGGLPPAAATSFVASDSLCYRIELEWVDASEDETGFVVMRDGAPLDTLPPNTTAYTDEDIAVNQTYAYTVVTTSSCGDGPSSAADSGIGVGELFLDPPALIAPADSACTPKAVSFEWEPVPDAAKYAIHVGSVCGLGNVRYEETTAPNIELLVPQGASLHWQVQVQSECGDWGTLSECRTFTASGDLPTVSHFGYEETDDYHTLRYVWPPVLGAEGYRLYLGRAPDACFTGEYDSVFAVAGTDTTLDVSAYDWGSGVLVDAWLTVVGCDGESEPSECATTCCDIPVALEYLDAATMTNGVHVTWETTSENRVMGFHVYRARVELGAFTRVNASLIPAGQFEYSLLDDAATDGHRYRYRLTEFTSDGVEVTLGHVEARAPYIPKVARLLPSRPNPFNPLTRVRFEVPGPVPVTIDIFNPSGQRVRRLVSEVFPAGRHEVVWRGRDDAGREVSSGTYFVRMQAGGSSNVGRLILLR